MLRKKTLLMKAKEYFEEGKRQLLSGNVKIFQPEKGDYNRPTLEAIRQLDALSEFKYSGGCDVSQKVCGQINDMAANLRKNFTIWTAMNDFTNLEKARTKAFSRNTNMVRPFPKTKNDQEIAKGNHRKIIQFQQIKGSTMSRTEDPFESSKVHEQREEKKDVFK